LYNILNDFGIPMERVSLTETCLNETYSTVRVGNNLSDMFPARNGWKQGDGFNLIRNRQTQQVIGHRLQGVLYKFNRTTCFGQLTPSSGP